MKLWLLFPLLLLLACGGGEDELGEWHIDVQGVGTSLLTHYAGQEVLLSITCNDKGFRAAIHTNIHSDYRGIVHPVRIKFDDDEPAEYPWKYWHFAESGFYKTSVIANDSGPFISQLLNANRLTVHISITETDSVSATWNDVGGFAIAYEAVESECGFAK